jgi:glutamate/aspartate transport system permease protein
MAAAASGLTLAQSYRYILLPIAARNVLPPLTSEFLNVVKNSSLALTIGLLELTGQSRQIESATFHGIEAFTAATLTYVVLTTAVIVALRAVERLVAIPGLMARA